MPAVKSIPGPYRFFVYSFDCNEPMHVHIQRERMICKFWIKPLALGKNQGFSAKELNMIRNLVKKNSEDIMEAWYEHCGKSTRNKN